MTDEASTMLVLVQKQGAIIDHLGSLARLQRGGGQRN